MSWCNELFATLAIRDSYEQEDKEVYDDYTRLADKLGRSDNDVAPVVSHDHDKIKAEPAFRLTEHLIEAQSKRSELQETLSVLQSELDKLRSQSRVDEKQLEELVLERSTMLVKLRDRDEEISGKTKLLEDLHDETVALTLQLNVSEEKNSSLLLENKDLVDRWMARMGQEADAMNSVSRFS